jgi:rhodanese-related sulfurtransferase
MGPMLRALARLIGRDAADPVRWVEPEALARQIAAGPAPLIVDVRGSDEFDGPLGHLPDAVNIPLDALAARHGEIAAAGRPVVLVCLTDKRSAKAAARLAAAGLRDLAVLRGGTQEWRRQGR